MDKDDSVSWFYEDEIQLIINHKPTKEELFKLPIGTKITTDLDENNVFVKTCKSKYENDKKVISDYNIEKDLSINNKFYGTKIIKIEVPTYETLYESLKEVKEMTIAEISEALGYEVKIIKED